MSDQLNSRNSILLGIGNSGRSDDGLGWAFLDAIEEASVFEGQIAYRYQLQVEDAELISHARRVVFVDAYRGILDGGFQWKPCTPAGDFAFTSHILAPEAILFLCRELFDRTPTAHLLLIQGDVWDLNIGLTDTATRNLKNALDFFRTVVVTS